MTHEPSTSGLRERGTPVRRRLPADTRVQQILGAALQAFAADGFAATRIDDIARRAGLSKGGIYTHFKSKDDIFETLLARISEQSFTPDEPVTVERLIERIVDLMYLNLNESRTIAVLRLLLAEAARVPHLVLQWRRTVIEPHLADIEALVRRGVAEGTLPRARPPVRPGCSSPRALSARCGNWLSATRRPRF